MKYHIAISLGVMALLASCTPEEKETPETPDTTEAVVFTIPDPSILEGHTVGIYEVIDDRKIEKVLPQFNGNKAEITFRQDEGGWHRYLLIVNDFDEGDHIIVGGGSHPIYRARSQEYRGRPESVNFTPSRLSSTFSLKLNGIPAGKTVTSVEVQFPGNSYVTSKYTLDATDGGNFKASPVDNLAVTAVEDGSSRTVLMEIAPCRITSGAKASVMVMTSDDAYTGTITFTAAADIREGKTFPAEVDLDNTKTFTNPVISNDWADPTIWKEGNRFFSIATGLGAVRTSTDLVNWNQYSTTVLNSASLAKAQSLGQHFWAPDVCKIGDKWMLYLTCYNSASDCGIFAFSSETAGGPFNYVGKITHSKDTGIQDTIDAEVVVDEGTGKVWLFFGSIGKVHRVELNSTGTALAKDARYVHVAGLTYNDDRTRSKVFEGSYLHYHDGWWYLFVSSGNYSNTTYMMKVGRSQSLEGTFLDKAGRKMTEGNATVVLSSVNGDELYGPGHNGEIFTDRTGQEYILYHCHDSKINTSPRYTLLQRVFWDKDGWPYFNNGKPAREDKAPIF